MGNFEELNKLKELLTAAGFTGCYEHADIVGDTFSCPIKRITIGFGKVCGNIISARQDEDQDTVAVFEEGFFTHKGTAQEAFQFFLRHKGERYYNSQKDYTGPVRRIGEPEKVQTA